MSTFYKFTQGVQEKIRVYDQNSILIIKNTSSILTFNNVVEEQNGDLWLTFTIDQNNYMSGGVANYQLFQNNQLKEYGSCQIIPSLLVNPDQDLRGRYKIIVDAIQAMLAGVATKGQRHIQVGDKTIQRYNTEDLMRLLNYFQGKLYEEEAQSNVNTKTDQIKIKYVWSPF